MAKDVPRFRPAAVAQLRSPEHLDSLVDVDPLRIWHTVVMIALVICLIFLWTTAGRVPVAIGVVKAVPITFGAGVHREIDVYLSSHNSRCLVAGVAVYVASDRSTRSDERLVTRLRRTSDRYDHGLEYSHAQLEIEQDFSANQSSEILYEVTAACTPLSYVLSNIQGSTRPGS